MTATRKQFNARTSLIKKEIEAIQDYGTTMTDAELLVIMDDLHRIKIALRNVYDKAENA